jgi:hypothetical protein
MSRITRFAVLVTALASLSGVVSATAGAVTWHNTGNSAFTATGGPGTLSVGANNLVCFASSARATAPSGSLLTSYSMGGTITFSPCTLAGQSTYVHCDFTFTASAFASGVTTGVADADCVAHLTANDFALCDIVGTTPAAYANPASPAKGKFTLSTSGTGLTVSHSFGTSCLLGTGTGHLSEQTVTITNASGGAGTLGPVINRTA